MFGYFINSFYTLDTFSAVFKVPKMLQKIKYEIFKIKDNEYKIRQDSIMCAVRLLENEALSNRKRTSTQKK